MPFAGNPIASCPADRGPHPTSIFGRTDSGSVAKLRRGSCVRVDARALQEDRPSERNEGVSTPASRGAIGDRV